MYLFFAFIFCSHTYITYTTVTDANVMIKITRQLQEWRQYVTRYGPSRPKLAFFRIELLILSLSTQFQDSFGPNPIFLPYSVTVRIKYFFVFTPYFCLYLSFTYADFGLHGLYHVTYGSKFMMVGKALIPILFEIKITNVLHIAMHNNNRVSYNCKALLFVAVFLSK